MTLDDLDRRILARLQTDALLTTDALAEKLPLSPSAIGRRVRRLREGGAIIADISVASPEVTGAFLSAVVQIQFDRHALPAIEAFRRRVLASDMVQVYLEVSGTFDVLMLVTVIDMAAFNEFADEMLADSGLVRRYETSFVKRQRKLTPALPIA